MIDELKDLATSYSSSSNPERFYNDQRQLHNNEHPGTNPARFILLNRTCWNGLWRVNQKGLFNVPHGSQKSGPNAFPSREQMLAVSKVLQGASLRCSSWETTLASASRGDFIFADPPYFSDAQISNKRSQPKYHTDGFGLDAHQKLADTLVELSSRGVDFILTNSTEPEMQEIYGSHGLDVEIVKLPRSINSRSEGRSSVEELVVRPPSSTARPSFAATLLDFEAFRLKTRQQYLGGNISNTEDI